MLTNFINSEILLILILSAALIAIALEVLIPSFGVIGLAGVYLLVESILAIQNFENPYRAIFISIVIALIMTVVISKYLLRNMKNNRLVLNQSMSVAKGNKNKAVGEDFVGKTGIVVKVLRPSGEVKIEDEVYDAISNGDFIDRNSKVIVEEIKGSQLICKKID